MRKREKWDRRRRQKLEKRERRRKNGERIRG
jgi:hypothetical protein